MEHRDLFILHCQPWLMMKGALGYIFHVFCKKNDHEILRVYCTEKTYTSLYSPVYWFHLVHLTVHLSLCLWIESCQLCIFNNTCWIHFISIVLLRNLRRCIRCRDFHKMPKYEFIVFFLICNFDFVLFWINSVDGVAEVFSEHRYTSFSRCIQFKIYN